MTEENTAPEVEDTPKGVPEGVTSADLDDGQATEGAGIPKAPEISNKAPEAEDDKPEEEETPAEEESTDDAPAEDAEEDTGTDEEDSDEQEEELTEYPEYGDETADAVVAVLKDAGIDVKVADQWFREAVETGDLSKIPMDEIVEAVGKQQANLIMLGVKEYYNRTIGAVQESVRAVHEVCGSEENWNKVAAWARKQADGDADFQKQVDAWNAMLDLNKPAAIAAAKELVSAYEEAEGNSSLNKTVVSGDSPASLDSTEFTMDRETYLSKMKVAHDKHDIREVARLRTIRTESKKRGY